MPWLEGPARFARAFTVISACLANARRNKQVGHQDHREHSAQPAQVQATRNETPAQPPEAPLLRSEAVHESRWDELKARGAFSPTVHYPVTVAVLIVGAQGIGKKSLLRRLLYDDMDGGLKMEQALFDQADENAHFYCDGRIYDVHVLFASDNIFSYAGLVERFDYYGVIAAYDVRSYESFLQVPRLCDAVLHDCGSGGPPCPVMVVGLHSDAHDEERAVSGAEALKLATDRGFTFTECSAKTGNGVHETFSHFIQEAQKSGKEESVLSKLYAAGWFRTVAGLVWSASGGDRSS
ncbi:P-loop containing nucleoside triphosphate hydrolase protein [Lasiosphaeria miniovina]|uniref:P-loop containing nucleoside triphosphate hydrolase protein n=1 Tax=Lasiosphaeria miniovina TaxID=1954250 RepID=A0AA40B4L0_9PEZI|nr:P-loop containing nucleoside triphosphate hydrolase protein [Lasiosphaeria miniovina]KAK0727591.1 P-loop containing nucleoside triphosphate hydrolase protein [Lasiosphaeria miniovina]